MDVKEGSAENGGDSAIPSIESLMKTLENMGGINEENIQTIKEKLLAKGQLGQDSRKFFSQLQLKGGTFDILTLLGLIAIIVLLFVLFGYKLYKSLMEREKRKEEKKRQKQQKKKK